MSIRRSLGSLLLLTLPLLPSADAAPPAPAPAPATATAPAAAPVPAEIEAYRETVDAIVRDALVNGEAYAALERLCTVAPKRLSGSPGAAAAVEWGRQEMQASGFDNVRIEPVTVPHWQRGKIQRLCIATPAEAAGEELTICALGMSIGTPPGGITAPVIEVQSLEEATALGAAAKGKIIFYNRPLDRSRINTGEAYGGAVDQRGRGGPVAAEAGAVAAIVRSMTTRLDDEPHTGAMRYDPAGKNIPACAVSTVDAERLSALLKRGAEVTVHLELDCGHLPDENSFNVVGELLGSKYPEQIVLVGGHLDAWDVGHGAHDDGAGCAHSLEVIRILKRLGLKPKRTIRAVLFMNEENGLAGAKKYRETHVAELKNHVAAIETDAGGFTPIGFGSNARGSGRDTVRAIVSLLEPIHAASFAEDGGGADVGVLEPDGVPLIGFRPDSQRYFDLHHTNADTFDKVNERELHLGAAAIASLAYILADMEQRLPPNPAAAEATK